MATRPDDVWVTTFPRSGTTWSQELVWLLMNDLDFDTAVKNPLNSRYITLERYHITYLKERNLDLLDPTLRLKCAKEMLSYEAMNKAPSPRFFKTHIAFSLLPRNLLDCSKVVYVARDPRDVAVSLYHHQKLTWFYDGDFKSFWNLFINDLVVRSPYLTHLREAWALRQHPNMLFIFYENMKKDLPSSIKRVSNFLGKKVNEEQIAKLCEHLAIENFRNNKSVHPTWRAEIFNPDAEPFVRKGKSGGWREYFDEKMAAQAQRWMREGLAGSGLRFPHDSSLAF
ncbi:LOW QUALITY PROTEIN: luciferin sulfotransferase-like [Leguminivora glycinivorella]|uniref:LOW QUALITY PROTEIN: luciferin sulfotransferase-like n=1 Tax=Leguminivora glycinivorella TaxID=1035111 RepID=UPI00200C73E2|nr:LOW QUALITY PROTEIN: luciferin sulfotransferase-like [Leguminivora glycinivorella]